MGRTRAAGARMVMLRRLAHLAAVTFTVYALPAATAATNAVHGAGSSGVAPEASSLLRSSGSADLEGMTVGRGNNADSGSPVRSGRQSLERQLSVDQMGCAWIPLRSAHKAPTAARNAGGGESSAQEPSRAE